MRQDIEEYCRFCDDCQYRGSVRKNNHLHPIVPTKPFNHWRIDIIGPFQLPPNATDILSLLQTTSPISQKLNPLSVPMQYQSLSLSTKISYIDSESQLFYSLIKDSTFIINWCRISPISLESNITFSHPTTHKLID